MLDFDCQIEYKDDSFWGKKASALKLTEWKSNNLHFKATEDKFQYGYLFCSIFVDTYVLGHQEVYREKDYRSYKQQGSQNKVMKEG